MGFMNGIAYHMQDRCHVRHQGSAIFVLINEGIGRSISLTWWNDATLEI